MFQERSPFALGLCWSTLDTESLSLMVEFCRISHEDRCYSVRSGQRRF